jgi:hypothetical protein
MILNLQQAGKLGGKSELAKYPLYNSMKGLVDEKNYQRAQIYEFKEKNQSDKQKKIAENEQ